MGFVLARDFVAGAQRPRELCGRCALVVELKSLEGYLALAFLDDSMIRRNSIEIDRLRDENYDLRRETQRQRGLIQGLEDRLAELSSSASKTMFKYGETPCGGCGQTVAVLQAYRCFHCGLWFCRECSREHFLTQDR